MTTPAPTGYPQLRPDLEIIRSAPEPSGAPTWVVHDAFAGNFLRIGWLEHEIMKRWHLGDADAIVESVTRETTLDVQHEDVSYFAEFLTSSGFVRIDRALERSGDRRPGFWRQFGSWRFALVSPNSFLQKTLGLPRTVLSPVGAVVIVAMLLVVLLQLSAEWSGFKSSIIALLQPSMLGHFLMVLVGVKVVHELGHAWACRHYGLDVPAMGVAIFFLWPFLYTDTTAAWRLTSRRQRAFVAAAGVLAETVLALLALFLWCFVGDGEFRQTLLFVGVVSMVLTLVVNANPFMKWDGYYVLSDLLGLENMQSRAFAFGKWWLRCGITGVRDPEPEIVSDRQRAFMITYACGAWAYRVVLFTGLAALLYSFFFKLAGIALMAFVVMRYLVEPVVMEIRELLSRRDRFRWQKSNRFAAGLAALLVLLLVLPVDFSESTSAIVQPRERAELYASAPGQIVAKLVSPGDTVEPGAPLLRVASPALEQRQVIENLELKRASNLANRVDGNRARDNRDLVKRQLERQRASVARISELSSQLSLNAPFAGRVVWEQQQLVPGRWVNPGQPLLRVVDPTTVEATAYVDTAARKRLAAGNKAVFIPDDPAWPRIKLTLANLGESQLATLDHPGLAAIHGGPVPVRNAQTVIDNSLEPDGAWYALTFELRAGHGPVELTHELPGRIKINASPRWLLGPVFSRLKQLVVSESGF